jgi:hypothetical protein
LPGRRRKQEEWQDEDAGRQIGQQLRLDRRPARRLKRQQHHQRVLEQVVVEGAQKLRHEERRKAPGFQESELTAHGKLTVLKLRSM